MIARIWHGKTASKDFEAYTQFMNERAIPDYSQTPGFLGLSFLRSIHKDEAHFTLITYWTDLEIIKAFAGEDFEKAKYYPEDPEFLLEMEPHVQHHEVFAITEFSTSGAISFLD